MKHNQTDYLMTKVIIAPKTQCTLEFQKGQSTDIIKPKQ